jgi:hypothetical protein
VIVVDTSRPSSPAALLATNPSPSFTLTLPNSVQFDFTFGFVKPHTTTRTCSRLQAKVNLRLKEAAKHCLVLFTSGPRRSSSVRMDSILIAGRLLTPSSNTIRTNQWRKLIWHSEARSLISSLFPLLPASANLFRLPTYTNSLFKHVERIHSASNSSSSSSSSSSSFVADRLHFRSFRFSFDNPH